MGWLGPKWSLALLFLADGVAYGAWAGYLAVFKATLGLTNGQLTAVLLAVVIGSILSMPMAGYAASLRGTRQMSVYMGVAYAAGLLLLSRAGASYPLLIGAAFVFGMAKGAFDVSINSQAVSLEVPGQRSSMSMLQGCWSIGGLGGSALASFLIRHGGTAARDLAIVVGFVAVVMVVAMPQLGAGVEAAPSQGFQKPSGTLLVIGGLAFAGLMAEGAIADWTSVYLHADLRLSLSLSAAGFGVYAVAMAGMRFAGDWLAEHLSGRRLLLLSGSLIASGVAVLLLGSQAWTAAAGLMMAGLGTANIVPVLWNVAGRDPIGAGPAISIVATIGYFGLLAGPPLIGSLASATSLRTALWALCVAGVVVAAAPLCLGRAMWQTGAAEQ